jgi:hypothetical protein
MTYGSHYLMRSSVEMIMNGVAQTMEGAKTAFQLTLYVS